MATRDLISLEDLKALVSYDQETGIFRWRRTLCSRAKEGGVLGSWDAHGYKTVRLYKKSYKLHRLAWFLSTGSWPTGDIDHINGVRHDNRIANLRDISRKNNLENRRAPNKSKKSGLPLGVFSAKAGKFEARISCDNKSRLIGFFNTPDEAESAYIAAKRQLHAGCVI